MSWTVDHGFGLADGAAEIPRFVDDTDTTSLATQAKALAVAELED